MTSIDNSELSLVMRVENWCSPLFKIYMHMSDCRIATHPVTVIEQFLALAQHSLTTHPPIVQNCVILTLWAHRQLRLTTISGPGVALRAHPFNRELIMYPCAHTFTHLLFTDWFSNERVSAGSKGLTLPYGHHVPGISDSPGLGPISLTNDWS